MIAELIMTLTTLPWDASRVRLGMTRAMRFRIPRSPSRIRFSVSRIRTW
jgi:hypothetical protein